METTVKMQSVGVKDVDQQVFTKALAAFLKKSGKVKLPEWVDLVKTNVAKELAPYDEDWYYTRLASMARHIYVRSPVGVSTMTKIYGVRRNNGSCPSHWRRGQERQAGGGGADEAGLPGRHGRNGRPPGAGRSQELPRRPDRVQGTAHPGDGLHLGQQEHRPGRQVGLQPQRSEAGHPVVDHPRPGGRGHGQSGGLPPQGRLAGGGGAEDQRTQARRLEEGAGSGRGHCREGRGAEGRGGDVRQRVQTARTRADINNYTGILRIVQSMVLNNLMSTCQLMDIRQ